MVPTKDFSPQSFKVTDNVVNNSEAEDLDSEAASLCKQRQEEFCPAGAGPVALIAFTFLSKLSRSKRRHCFRKARIFKMRGLAGEDMLDSIETFFATRINMSLKFQDRTQINARFIQSTPCIAIFFPNVRAQSSAEAYESVKIPALHVSLLMAADTGFPHQNLSQLEFLAPPSINGCLMCHAILETYCPPSGLLITS